MKIMRTLVQCDFDGTITQEDISFLLLDSFTSEDWRPLLAEYRQGKISVGLFNIRAFAMIRADEQTLVKFVKHEAETRAGFCELLDYCLKKDYQFVVVSNGLDFYINAILEDIGVKNIEVFAAQARFSSRGIEAKYIGPGGNAVLDNFKEEYIRSFLRRDYRVVYIGNGISDISPARLAHRIFATGEMLTCCREMNLDCTPFNDLNDVVRGLELDSRG